MSENTKTDLTSRRDFIGKLNALGALSVSGNFLKPAPSGISEKSIGGEELTDYQINQKNWPTITYKRDSKVSRNNGPNLTNLHCRLDVPVSGNLSHFQVIGSNGETQFIQAVQATESFVFYKNQFLALEQSDEISFEYGLSYILVTYKNKALPFLVSKCIFMHPDFSCVVQHITIKNLTGKPVELFFVEKAKFTVGDPLYIMPAVQSGEGFSGFKLSNELFRNYTGKFLMTGKNVLKVFCRDDQIKYQMFTSKQAWEKDQYILRNCEDQSALLQKKLTIPAKVETEFAIYCSAGSSTNEEIHGISALQAIFQNDHFAQFRKELQKQADDYVMIRTPDFLLNQGFGISNKIAAQVFQSPDGLVALPGHMYANFYSRDSHWQIHGLLAAGKFEQVKNLLIHFIRYQNEEGSFPTRINLAGKPIYHTAAPDLDSAALIWLSVIAYIRWSKDFEFGEQNWKSITASVRFLQSKDIDGDGWIEQDRDQDWADRTKRHGKVNYTQSIYFQLLNESAALGEILNKGEASDYHQKASRLKENYDSLFWDEKGGFYLDYIAPDGTRMAKMSQDVCLAFIFGLATDARKIKSHLSKLKEKCWGKWGPAHHEGYKDGDKMDPIGFYCNGGVWMWLTAFEAFAHFRFGDPADGITALNAIKKYEFGENPYQAVYFDTTEWHDRFNGLNCENDWKQCRNFTTGSGAHVWAIVQGLFGLQIPMKGELSWDPKFPAGWKGKAVSINGIRSGSDRQGRDFVV